MAHKNVDYKPEDIQFPNQKIVPERARARDAVPPTIEYAMSVIGRARACLMCATA